MSLSATLKSAFDPGDRSRGVAYARDGAVFDLTVEQGTINAKVGGSYGHYEVAIDLEDEVDAEGLWCTCPRFGDGFNCKHLWATILEFDAQFIHEGGQSLITPPQRRSTERRHDAPETPSRPTTNNPKRRVSPAPARTTIGDTSIAPAKPAPAWQSLLSGLGSGDSPGQPGTAAPEPPAKRETEFVYVIDAADKQSPNRYLELLVLQRVRKQTGEWGRLKPFQLRHASFSVEDPLDEKIADHLLNSGRDPIQRHDGHAAFELTVYDRRELLDLLIASERFFWSADEDLEPESLNPILSCDTTKPFAILADITDIASPKNAAQLQFVIEQGKRSPVCIKDDQVVKLADDGMGLLTSSLIRIDNPPAISLWRNARAFPPIKIKKSERVGFLNQLANTPGIPDVRLPDSWSVTSKETAKPKGLLALQEQAFSAELDGRLFFLYGKTKFAIKDPRKSTFDEASNQWIQRNSTAEMKLLRTLGKKTYLEVTPDANADQDFLVHKQHLMQLVDELGQGGFEITLKGIRIKNAGDFDIAVESGLDWFDLTATVDFDGESIPLPSLLRALARKEDFIKLADGSMGMVPASLIQKYVKVAEFGQVEDDNIRFQPTQAMLLDAMLDELGDVSLDKGFKLFRKKLKSFTGIKPKTPPRSFQGELRKYQEDGLGWLHFLRDFRFGGCLADDMGLGKTIQVLALLESRRTRRISPEEREATPKKKVVKKILKKKVKKKVTKKGAAAETPDPILEAVKKNKPPSETEIDLVNFATSTPRKPSIVVVPKSLIFNWIDEAAKFTPKLRFLNYTGGDRHRRTADCVAGPGFDVLITTYGTMRKDIAELSAIEFDYAILDESQAIKNAKAQCAKASRLLRAEYRLAMTGTPIENHLGELWSLFEFLNPGMLGGSSNFARLTRQKKGDDEDRAETLTALSRALQPFVLRRTKEQVLTDLPAKTEQTLFCDMLPAQKKKYEELKEYYRVKLAKKIETKGISNAKIQVLEALLRLRQVACDPRLLDKKAKPGAKIDFLGQQIGEVVSEGHKVLVFSQFTSLLSLVQDQFDEAGIKYEYLDGKTSDRQGAVRRFQNDENISAFLISLKAGGHGLNLTAADYVYLLDPWWNPAVEAQAVDRAHRMGQQRPVIAYRMICRDTVEEKIVELQQSKQELADSIIRADESLIRSLTADDLNLLLS